SGELRVVTVGGVVLRRHGETVSAFTSTGATARSGTSDRAGSEPRSAAPCPRPDVRTPRGTRAAPAARIQSGEGDRARRHTGVRRRACGPAGVPEDGSGFACLCPGEPR